MIIADRKPFTEIWSMILNYQKIMILGCGTCMTICWAGGEKEVGILASQLKIVADKWNKDLIIRQSTIERQCEKEMVMEFKEKEGDFQAILSMGCGAGVQVVSGMFDEMPVFPALNTTFIGIPAEEGVWVEMCAACGDCYLFWTGGICPVIRCGKGLLNGPCGGTRKGGKCEIDPDKDCAWVLIYRRLEKLSMLDIMEKYHEPKNYRAVKRPGKITAIGR